MMSVEALFTVLHEGKPYQVEVSYNPGKSVAGVKKLIITDLKSTISVFKDIDLYNDWLTLKTLEGDVIVEDEMPKGKKFLAELLVPKSEAESKFLEKLGEKIEFAWREPYPLLQTEGSEWKYQEDPGLCNTLQNEIQMHYDNWVAGVRDK